MGDLLPTIYSIFSQTAVLFNLFISAIDVPLSVVFADLSILQGSLLKYLLSPVLLSYASVFAGAALDNSYSLKDLSLI